MSKSEAGKKLEEAGWKVYMRNNIPMVLYEGNEDPFDKIKDFLKDAGYHGSFGTERDTGKAKSEAKTAQAAG